MKYHSQENDFQNKNANKAVLKARGKKKMKKEYDSETYLISSFPEN